MKIQNKKKLIKKMINIYKKIWIIKIYLIDEYKQKKQIIFLSKIWNYLFKRQARFVYYIHKLIFLILLELKKKNYLLYLFLLQL